jgi:hypothetical protein
MDNVKRIVRIAGVMEGTEGYSNGDAFIKAMWRMTCGNRDKSFSIIKQHCKHYGFIPDDFDIDCALGELNGGVEIEWVS